MSPLKRSYQIFKGPRGNSGGFTLLESIISMAVMTLAIALIFYAFQATMKVLTEELSEADVSLEVHKGMERMVRELRGALEVPSAASTSITFWYRDLNGNGTRDAAETINYTWTGITTETLTRTMGSSTFIVANKIIDLSLTYDNPSSVKLVKIKITGIKGTSVSTLESSVKLRNL